MPAPLSPRRGLHALLLAAWSLSPGHATAQDASWSRAHELRGIEAGCFVYDSARDRLILIDGSREGLPTDEIYISPAGGTPDWRWLETSGPNPPARMQATAIYDPLRDRVLMIGGGTGTADVPATLWSLSLAGPGQPAWSAVGTAGGGAAAPRRGGAPPLPPRRR